MLLIREDTRIEIWHESITLLTVDAEGGLLDASHIDGAFFLAEAFGAGEVRLFHLGHDVAVTDDNAAKGD